MSNSVDRNTGHSASGESHDHEHSIAIGERALGYLRQLRASAVPRNYAIFYTLTASAGANKQLSTALRKAIESNSRLTEEDAVRIHETYIEPNNNADRVSAVGQQISEEISGIITVIAKAGERAGDFSHSLEDITDQLGLVQSPEQLKLVANKLVSATTEIADDNRSLEQRLDESRRQIEELHHNLETARTESLTDPLTQLGNRKKFDQVLAQEMRQAEGSGDPLCLIMTDIDHFKRFNDTYGHQTGDQVLRLVAHILKTNVKGRDHPARYGGEEMGVVLPQTTLRDGVALAQQLRTAIRAKELVKKSTGESLGHITVSLGVARYREGEPAENLIHRADACLYAAKRAGRDRVKCETDPDVALDIQAA